MRERLIDRQARMRQLGEVRMGRQVPTGRNDRNGNPTTRPEKLKTWRLTSPDRGLLEAAAAIYGGTVQPWKSPTGDEWEVITESSELEVIVSERDMMMRYEEWSAAGLKRDCDGETCREADGQSGYRIVPCSCTPDSGDCKGVMRFSLIIPGLPGIGEWKFESHGIFASLELPQMVNSLISLFKRGGRPLVLLGIEEREIKKPGVQTKKFIVPYLKPKTNVSFGSLLGLPGYESAPALEAPVQQSAPALPSHKGQPALPNEDQNDKLNDWIKANFKNDEYSQLVKESNVTKADLYQVMVKGKAKTLPDICQEAILEADLRLNPITQPALLGGEEQ